MRKDVCLRGTVLHRPQLSFPAPPYEQRGREVGSEVVPEKNEEEALICLFPPPPPHYPVYFYRLSGNCPHVKSAMPVTVTGK